MSESRVKWEVIHNEVCFSRSEEMPITHRGYSRTLAEDLHRAVEAYTDKIRIAQLETSLAVAEEALSRMSMESVIAYTAFCKIAEMKKVSLDKP